MLKFLYFIIYIEILTLKIFQLLFLINENLKININFGMTFILSELHLSACNGLNRVAYVIRKIQKGEVILILLHSCDFLKKYSKHHG